MTKIYAKEVWVDEVLTEDARYNILTDAGAPVDTEIQIVLTTPVSVAGTAVDAAVMNNLEDGVDAIDTIVSRMRSLTTQAAAAGTTTLTVASDRKQEFTGTTTETVVMPVVSTLVLGDEFTIINNSTGILTVNSSGGNLIASIAAGTVVDLVCVLITGTDAASWDVNSGGAVKATGAELDTGTDDAKFATAKAIKDSANVPSVAPGADGNVLTAASGVWTSAAPAGGGVVVRTQVFTASGTYTPNAYMTHAIVEAVGGGGGGGGVAGASGSNLSGGGGGAGGYSRKLVTAADIGASKTVTIGAGGAGGASGANAGSAGGATSLGTLCVGNGGSGGAPASTGSVPSGGAGGAAGTGDIAGKGAGGSPGLFSSITTVIISSGMGGSSTFGGGAPGVGSGGGATATGAAASNYGGGGSGGAVSNVAGNAAGGAGSAGIVVVTEYCTQ